MTSDYKLFLLDLIKTLDILIEKEIERKQECRDNWTVSEYAYHNGKEAAYSELKKEICKDLIPDY